MRLEPAQWEMISFLTVEKDIYLSDFVIWVEIIELFYVLYS